MKLLDVVIFPVFYAVVAFTPKGGCPLKRGAADGDAGVVYCVAFTPKGGCPLKHHLFDCVIVLAVEHVAFTPKGGCPLKLSRSAFWNRSTVRSIHPQGWVPVETGAHCAATRNAVHVVAFTPKGGCPLKLKPRRTVTSLLVL